LAVASVAVEAETATVARRSKLAVLVTGLAMTTAVTVRDEANSEQADM